MWSVVGWSSQPFHWHSSIEKKKRQRVEGGLEKSGGLRCWAGVFERIFVHCQLFSMNPFRSSLPLILRHTLLFYVWSFDLAFIHANVCPNAIFERNFDSYSYCIGRSGKKVLRTFCNMCAKLNCAIVGKRTGVRDWKCESERTSNSMSLLSVVIRRRWKHLWLPRRTALIVD